MQISQAQLQILIDAKNQASAVLKQVQGDTEGLEKKAGTLSSAFKGLMGVVATYAGTQGLGSLISAYQESALQTAQARFFLAGHTKDIDGAMAAMQKFGDEIERTTGVSGEHATLVAAKMVPRLKDMNKARQYASVLLKGERLGLTDATQSANMLMRANDGGAGAMRRMAEELGISIPAFASLDSIMASLNARYDEGLKSLDPLTTQWNILKESFGNIMESGGQPVVEFLATKVKYLNELIQKYPELQGIVSAAMIIISTVLAGAGLMMMGSFVMPFLSALWSIGVAIVTFIAGFGLIPIAIAVGIAAVVAGLVWMYYNWNTVVGWLKALWAGLVYAWDVTIDFLSDKMLAGVDILKNAWGGFKQFWMDVWEGIKSAVQGAWDYIRGIVDQIIAAVNKALAAMASIGGGMVGKAVTAVANFAGFRADGGQVSAGKTYMVGERGAEFFTPSTNGYITPNGGGAGTVININNPTILDETGARRLVDFTLDAFGRSHLFGQ